MDRKIYQKLLVWKEKNSKMPYMLVGARQTGKTYILTNFCKNEFKNYLYLNLDSMPEIKEIFETTVIQWFDDSTKQWSRRELFDAVWNEDSEKVAEEMSKLLRKTISYHDYREDFYHAFLAGIFAGAGYAVESNREHGEGRSDVVVSDPMNGRVAVFEAKYADSLQSMERKCDEALCQMDEKMYAREYEDDYDQIVCYGIAFFKKRCLVRSK